jgi:hypothetical protein
LSFFLIPSLLCFTTVWFYIFFRKLKYSIIT